MTAEFEVKKEYKFQGKISGFDVRKPEEKTTVGDLTNFFEGAIAYLSKFDPETQVTDLWVATEENGGTVEVTLYVEDDGSD